MVFSSPTFLLMFLPLVLLLFYIVPSKYRNLVIAVASLYFYAFGEKFLVILIFLSTVINYYCGILISKNQRKKGIIISILFNLLTLGFFKYFNFTFDNFNLLLNFFDVKIEFIRNLPVIALPIGISFYTFQTLSYSIDVYKRKLTPTKDLLLFRPFLVTTLGRFSHCLY